MHDSGESRLLEGFYFGGRQRHGEQQTGEEVEPHVVDDEVRELAEDCEVVSVGWLAFARRPLLVLQGCPQLALP